MNCSQLWTGRQWMNEWILVGFFRWTNICCKRNQFKLTPNVMPHTGKTSIFTRNRRWQYAIIELSVILQWTKIFLRSQFWDETYRDFAIWISLWTVKRLYGSTSLIVCHQIIRNTRMKHEGSQWHTVNHMSTTIDEMNKRKFICIPVHPFHSVVIVHFSARIRNEMNMNRTCCWQFFCCCLQQLSNIYCLVVAMVSYHSAKARTRAHRCVYGRSSSTSNVYLVESDDKTNDATAVRIQSLVGPCVSYTFVHCSLSPIVIPQFPFVRWLLPCYVDVPPSVVGQWMKCARERSCMAESEIHSRAKK